MRQVHIGGEVRTIKCCPRSFIVYERAFAGSGHTLDGDTNEFVQSGTNLVSVLPMGALMRIEYALEASVDGATLPSFDVWVDELPEGVLNQFTIKRDNEWAADLFAELQDTFFRAASDENVGATPEGDSEDAA